MSTVGKPKVFTDQQAHATPWSSRDQDKLCRRDLAAAKQTVKKQERHDAVDAVHEKIEAEFAAVDPGDAEAEERSVPCGPGHFRRRGKGHPRADPRRPTPRRPRLCHRSPHLRRGRPAAPHPRLAPLHPRRNPGPGHRDPGHRRGRADRRRPGRGIRQESSCSTTTSRRSPTGEVKRIMGPGRREIGHGALAERSPRSRAAHAGHVPLRRPPRLRRAWNPTAVRPWPQCARGTLALLDAGVPIIRPVAGISIGLVDGRRPRGTAHRHHRRGRSLRRHGLQGLRHHRRASPAFSST